MAPLHPEMKPSQPKTCLTMPSWTARAKDAPRWTKMGQDGPKMGPKRAADHNGPSSQDNSGGPLGPVLGHLKPSKNNVFCKVFR